MTVTSSQDEMEAARDVVATELELMKEKQDIPAFDAQKFEDKWEKVHNGVIFK